MVGDFLAAARFDELAATVDREVKAAKLRTFAERGQLTDWQQEAGMRVRPLAFYSH